MSKAAIQNIVDAILIGESCCFGWDINKDLGPWMGNYSGLVGDGVGEGGYGKDEGGSVKGIENPACRVVSCVCAAGEQQGSFLFNNVDKGQGGHSTQGIAETEGSEDMLFNLSSTDSRKSDRTQMKAVVKEVKDELCSQGKQLSRSPVIECALFATRRSELAFLQSIPMEEHSSKLSALGTHTP
ncbi:hypothetical protein Ancab_003964 [Ancistrocladus abbreviatus]